MAIPDSAPAATPAPAAPNAVRVQTLHEALDAYLPHISEKYKGKDAHVYPDAVPGPKTRGR